MKRIVILGNAGSGKSTLARRLGERLGLPVVHLDVLFWEPGWKEPDNQAFRDRVRAALSGDSWICEGNYARRTFDIRLPRCDLVIWLDTPRLVCLQRVVTRTLRGGARPDLAEGCREQFDAEYAAFLRFVWGFDRTSRGAIDALRQRHGAHVPVVHLRRTRDIEAFLRTAT